MSMNGESAQINSQNIQVLQRGDPRLEQQCEPVSEQDHIAAWVQQLATALSDYRRRTGFGRAISAPQIGVNKRIIVLDLGAGPIALINPEIVWRSDSKYWVWDDCLSVPDVIVKVQRHVSISLRYFEIDGRERLWSHLNADMAELIQHEMDHLNGVLMTQRPDVKEVLPIAERERIMSTSRRMNRLRLTQVELARQQIHPEFLHSPQYFSDALSKALACDVLIKLETLNPIRSFKGRGASFLLSEIAKRYPNHPPKLIAASAGNWGQALAYECRRLGWPIRIYAALDVNPLKLERMRDMGAEIVLDGADYDAAKSIAKSVAKEEAALFLEDGLQAEVAEGHATIALEILQSQAELDAIIAPLGNGALLNGIALWTKAADPAISIIGVCARGATSMRDSWKLGPDANIVQYESIDTIADGIGVRCPIPEAVADMHGQIDDVVTVSDETMLQAMRLIHEHLGVVAEPAGAASLAAILEHAGRFHNQRVAVIITGSNLTQQQMSAWL